jgi:hypothetical protein
MIDRREHERRGLVLSINELGRRDHDVDTS